MTHSRRHFIVGAGAGLLTSACSTPELTVNDISQLERTQVAGVAPVTTTEEVVATLSKHRGWVSVAGGRFSMGGQTSADQAVQLDTDALNRVLWLDVERKVVRVQAGMRWRALQDHLDPHDLSVKVMQSFSNFSVGGSVSVNCHGRYVGAGSIASSVRALQLVLSSGEVLECSRTENPDLFAGVLGGYGLLGIVTEVELDLAPNQAMERRVEAVALADYPAWFEVQVRRNPQSVMHNADLVPPHFDQPLAITWSQTAEPLTDERRLIPVGASYSGAQNAIWAVSELPGGPQARASLGKKRLSPPCVIRRNLEASLDVASLEPRTRVMSTYLLQEYFIPVRHFHAFATQMAHILAQYKVNALNVSIRHAPADPTALMRWAPEEVFCFVLYYKQRRYPWSDEQTVGWTRALVDSALACQGRYYLPYRPHATREQFLRAYPEAYRFIRLKQEVDPNMRLVNHLWQRYLAQLV